MLHNWASFIDEPVRVCLKISQKEVLFELFFFILHWAEVEFAESLTFA